MYSELCSFQRTGAPQSYGVSNYTVYACYDFAPPTNAQPLTAFGTYQSVSTSTPTTIAVTANSTSLSFPFNNSVSSVQAGALFAFNHTDTVLARFGVSFHDADRACANAEEEIPDWDWVRVQGASVGAWEDVLARVAVDLAVEDPTVVELLYSSVSSITVLKVVS